MCPMIPHKTKVHPPPPVFFFHFLLGRRRTLRSSRDDWRRELFEKQTYIRAAAQWWVVLEPEAVWYVITD